MLPPISGLSGYGGDEGTLYKQVWKEMNKIWSPVQGSENNENEMKENLSVFNELSNTS
jgi:hypothetical protein